MSKSVEDIAPRKLGSELRLARERRGMTQAEAAGVINVGRTTMTAIENGDRRIREQELISLAKAYGRSVNEILRDRPEIADFRVEYRGPHEPSSKDRKQIQDYENTFEELCRDYVELERIAGAPLERDYPPEYETGKLSAKEVAEEIAQRERSRLGLGQGPLGDFRSLLEEKVGIRIFYIEMYPSSFSEMYYYDDEVGACIAINQLHSPERQLWSLAHGYVHFLAHRYQPIARVEGEYERHSKRERLADQGALYLTMPTSELQSRSNKIRRSKGHLTPADLCILAHYFGVSVAAVTRRLEGMGLLKTGTWDMLKDKGFKARETQDRLGLERPLASSMLPFRYRYLALEALHTGLISEKQFADFLRVSRFDARDTALQMLEHATDITLEGKIDIDLSQPLTS